MYDIATIKNKKDINEYHTQIIQFESIYTKTFPVDEQEPFWNIIDRIKNESKPITLIYLALENNNCIGGLIMDYYPECHTIWPTYMVVEETQRKRGVGKTLLSLSLYEYPNIEHLFFETENPQKIQQSSINPTERLKRWLNWGYEIVPISYVQPPLSSDKNWETNLLLLHKGKVSLTKETLKTILNYFYKYLGQSDSKQLQNMIKEIDEQERL